MLFFSVVSLLLVSSFPAVSGQSGGCQGRVNVGSVCACSYKPADGKYYLTSFDDGHGAGSCSCGSCHMLGAYFLANRSRWPCGTRIKICRGSKCVVAGVTDFGPGCSVEDRAGGPVIDASIPVCQHLFGTTSCGWSDRYGVTATVVSSSTPFGPTTGAAASNPDPVDPGSGGNNNPTTGGQCGTSGVAGTCQDTSRSCSTGYLTGKCPGGTNIKCCPAGASTSSGGNDNGGSWWSWLSPTPAPTTKSSSSSSGSWWDTFFGGDAPAQEPSQSYCGTSGVAGVCQSTSTRCARPYLRGKCPGSSSIRCCPAASSWAFLMGEPGIEDEIDNELPQDTGLTAGYIALIAIGAIVFALAVGICMIVALRKRRAGDSAVVANVLYVASGSANDAMMQSARDAGNESARIATPNGTLGHFTCSECGKAYDYAEDLTEHSKMRHGTN